MKVLGASCVLFLVSAGVAIEMAPNVDRGYGLQSALADLRLFKLSVDLYQQDNKALPSNAMGLKALLPAEGPASSPRNGYLGRLTLDPWQSPYVYRHDSTAGSFSIYSFGPNRRDEAGQGDDVVLDKQDYPCESFNICPTFEEHVSNVAAWVSLAAALVFIGSLVRTVWLKVRKKKSAPPAAI